MTKVTNVKLKILGQTLVLDEVDKPIVYGFENQGNKKARIESDKLINPEACILKSRRTLRDLISSNAFQYKNKLGKKIYPMFLTTTFAENLQDFTEANRQFHNFIKRISYLNKINQGQSLKYNAVHEFQKRGAIHFHSIIYNLEFIERIFSKLKNIWDIGSVYNKTIYDLRTLSIYVSKYMHKQFSDNHTKNQKRFYSSKGLLKPMIFRDSNEIHNILAALPKDIPYKECESFLDQ